MKESKLPEISRRNLLGTSLGSSAALIAGTASAARVESGDRNFKTNGAKSKSLEEFRTLNGKGSVARLIGSMECELLSGCHKRMKEKEGIWIPELVPLFNEIDAKTHPGRA